MAKLYYDGDADLGLLQKRPIAIIGYGSQGHAHALNLRDSGLDVRVGLYEGSKSWSKAIVDGLRVMSVRQAADEAEIIMILAPDTMQSQIYRESVGPALKPGNMLMFAHGFNIHYGQIVPPKDVDVTMIAPKGPGHLVRSVYAEGGGVPSLVAVHQDTTGQARDKALAYAKGIGAGRAGILDTTFKEETETDLFGEQSVLCGGLSALIKAGFETLVEAGYQPESAYFECLHEVKLIVDLIYQGGLEYMRYSISDTAEYGDYVSGPRVVGPQVKAEMQKVLKEIQDGSFATRWILENQAGRPNFNALRRHEAEHPVETVGKELRGLMGWLKKPVM